MLLAFIFLLILGKLFFIQVKDGEWLQAKAAEQWYRDLPLKATRGTISDTNGVTLATSYTTYDIYIKPSRIKDSNKVGLTLSNILGIEYETIFNKICNIQYSEVLVKQKVDETLSKKVIAAGLTGVVLSENSARYYPYGNLLTQVLGYTTIDNIGQSGLEEYYDKYLKGVNGYALEESDVNGVKLDNTLSSFIPSISGSNINLTIDVNIQKLCENALLELVKEHEQIGNRYSNGS